MPEFPPMGAPMLPVSSDPNNGSETAVVAVESITAEVRQATPHHAVDRMSRDLELIIRPIRFLLVNTPIVSAHVSAETN
ncbi:hypothetical protein [Hoyosella rhizosphaerae]|uniref:hypothetical protein n=1 Tax=Hoyosella rhizosphaerae TaxID=1755582 RepID=UPI001E5641DC|nr:hypothetical protein [Hoyosella rhizosphaerae]